MSVRASPGLTVSYLPVGILVVGGHGGHDGSDHAGQNARHTVQVMDAARVVYAAPLVQRRLPDTEIRVHLHGQGRKKHAV